MITELSGSIKNSFDSVIASELTDHARAQVVGSIGGFAWSLEAAVGKTALPLQSAPNVVGGVVFPLSSLQPIEIRV